MEKIVKGTPVYVNAKSEWSANHLSDLKRIFIALSQEKDLHGCSRRVLDYLFGNLCFDTFVYVSPAEICNILGLQRSNLCKYLKLLEAKKLIIKGPKFGNAKSYKINKNYGLES